MIEKKIYTTGEYNRLFKDKTNFMPILITFAHEFGIMLENRKTELINERNQKLKAGDFSRIVDVAYRKMEAIWEICGIKDFEKRWKLFFATIVVPVRELEFDGNYTTLLAEQFNKPVPVKKNNNKINKIEPKTIEQAIDHLISTHVIYKYNIDKYVIESNDYDLIKLIYSKKLKEIIKKYSFQFKTSEESDDIINKDLNDEIQTLFNDFNLIESYIFGNKIEDNKNLIRDNYDIEELRKYVNLEISKTNNKTDKKYTESNDYETEISDKAADEYPMDDEIVDDEDEDYVVESKNEEIYNHTASVDDEIDDISHSRDDSA